ncbi:hypothetical protein PN498_26050 [Oscillatoria sp. CS-180]|nr:hypothetical protein [Oscillatoria sp. CS-180]MDB9529480.1 hypothetical protein [Oscillatoria sp. CS-180]
MKFRTFARWTCAAALGGTVLAGNVSMPRPLVAITQSTSQSSVTTL